MECGACDSTFSPGTLCRIVGLISIDCDVHHMQIEVHGQTELLIRCCLRGGRYSSPEEVVEEAVRQFAQRSGNGVSPPPLPREGGYWRGRIVIADDFDELPPDLEEAFGLRGS